MKQMLATTMAAALRWAALGVGSILVLVGLRLLYRGLTGKVVISLPKGVNLKATHVGLAVILLGVACVALPFVPAGLPSGATGDVTAGSDVREDVITGGRDVTGHMREGLWPDDVAQIVENATATPGRHLRDQGEEIGRLKEQLAAAIRRAQEAERRGEPDAEGVLKALRESGDTEQLLAFLVRERDRSREDFVQLEREIAAVAYLRGDIDTAQGAVNEILGILPDDLDTISKLAHIHQLRGQLDDAHDLYSRLLELAGEQDDEGRQAVASRNLALIHLSRGELDNAETMYRRALEIEEQLGRRAGMAAAYGNLGLIYKARGDLDTAEQMLRTSLEINQELSLREGMADAYGNLSLVFRARGDLHEAEQMLRKSLEIDEDLGRREGMAKDYANLGVIYKIRGDLDAAEQMQHKALIINEQLGRRDGVAKNYANLGLIAQLRGDVAGAREMWTKARDLFREIGMPSMVDRLESWLDGLPDADG